MHKIGVWGQYGDGGKIADGQAVRTTIITKELVLRYGENNIGIVNTNKWKSHPLVFLQRKMMFFNLFYRRKLIHIVIGGYLPALLSHRNFYLKLENKFDAIFVQTENIKRDLESLGVKRISISSNPKRLNTRNIDEIKIVKDKNIKVCVFSRINAEKGIEERLDYLLEKNKSFLKYNGIIDYDKTVETLKDYFVMLFPTYYHGEGFPGNVIDAYNTGLPMIATDWLYNSDVVLDGKTGLLVPIKNPRALSDAILKLYYDRELHYNLSINSLEEAQEYTPEIVLASLYNCIDSLLG